MISINNLHKKFGNVVAANIDSYSIRHGEMVGLVGNNGAGKTTLFRLILDLLKADEGNVTLTTQDGTLVDADVTSTEDWKRHTGAFIDDSFLIDYLTPDEYFHFLGRIYGLKKEDVDARLEKFRAFFNGEILGEKKYIRDYSMGNKQKIGIVSAMLHTPELLILDEPFNFLDPSSQAHIKHLLEEYNKETHATVLISSHNLNHTVEVCPRIALLEHGVIIRDIDNTNHTAESELESYFDVSSNVQPTEEETVLEEASSEETIPQEPSDEKPLETTDTSETNE
ncbi:MAG: ABC transporter ATP-binding protein [Bacteroidaceae bacterium]|nr:ABC transporter ATP-binding protein [Bacteroidaceae bacterium]